MEQLKPLTLQHSAYREIKRRIVTLVYKPGEQINTAQICAQLHIGRTPVHLAIHRLETEGLIEILPRRGIVVRAIDRAEVTELIEARMLLEPIIASLAAERASDSEIAAMRAALDRLPPVLEAGDGERFMELDLEFHRILALAARNRPISDLLASLHERCMRIYFLSVSRNEHDVRIMDEHEAIFASLQKRDAEGVSAAMRKHIQSLRRNVDAIIAEPGVAK